MAGKKDPAKEVEDLQKAKDDGTLEEKLIPIDLITSRYPKIELTKQEYRDFKDGKEVAVQKDRAILSETCDMSAANLYLEGELKAVAKAQSRVRRTGLRLRPALPMLRSYSSCWADLSENGTDHRSAEAG